MRYDLQSKSIDALRGIAAVTVFFSHSDTSGLATNPWLSANKGFLGEFGVYVFFCLSGYLIWQSGTKLLGTPQGLSRYAIHRVTRLAPLYLINLLAVATVVGWIGSRWTPTFNLEIVLRHLTFTQDIYPSVARSINPVLWTLTHEATFYILVPLVLLGRIRDKYLILFASIALYVALLTSDTLKYVKFAQTFYAFAIGIFIAEAASKERILISLISSVIALASLLGDSTLHAYAGPFAGTAFAVLVLCLTKGKECGRFLSVALAPVVFLGVISYSLYIWHYQIIYVVEYYYPFFNRNVPGWSQYGLVSGTILCAICIAFSYLSYLLIEKPSMGRWRKAIESSVYTRTALVKA